MALRAEPGTEEATLAYLRDRELVSSAYVERHVRLGLEDGRQVEALAYVINRDHWQYCRDIPLEDQARIIARAVGGRGRIPNTSGTPRNIWPNWASRMQICNGWPTGSATSADNALA